MATQAYNSWVAAGRPFRRPPWLSELKALAAQHGVPFLGDLGNDAHLKSSNPQDHTPFSATEWPVQIGEYVINAIDLGDGPWSDRILADARAGRQPWLKYMNFRGRQYSRKTSPAWVARTNSDSHLHLSGMSDHTWAGLDGYNPFVATPLEDDMALTDTDVMKIWTWDLVDGPGVGQAYQLLNRVVADVAAIKEAQTAPAAVSVDAAAVAAALAENGDFLAAVAKAVNDDAHARSAE